MRIKLIFILLINSFNLLAQTELQYFLDIQNVNNTKKEGTAAQGHLFLIHNKAYDHQRFKASLIGTHGESPTKLVGDLQTTSNLDIGSIETIKVFELFYEYQFNDFQLLGGMFDLASEFNVTEPASFFIHSSPGTSAGLAAAGKFGAAFNPFSALSIRAHVDFSEKVYFKSAITDATPFNPKDPFGTQFSFDPGEGVFALYELGFLEEDLYKLSLGFWEFSKISDKGYYLSADYKFSEKFHPFIRYGKVIENPKPFETNTVFGFTSLDWGFMYSHVNLESREFTASVEEAYELSYQYNLNSFSFVPHFQYVQNPGLSEDDAIILGLRIACAYTF